MQVWKMPQAIQIGQNIRDRRKQLGLTQSHLATGLFSVQTMSLIERGKLNVTPETLAVLAERLQCGVDELRQMHDLQEEWLEELLDTSRRYQKTNKTAKAIELLHTLYTEAFAKNNTHYLLESSYHLCLLYHDSGRHTTSTDWGKEALRLLNPDADLDRTLKLYSTIGHNYYRLGEIWEAFDLLRDAEALVDQHQHTSEQAGRLYYTMGILKQMLGNWESCIWYSSRALPIFEGHDMVLYIGRTMMMMGIAYKNLDRYEKSHQHIERSLRILSQTSDLASLGRSYHALADLESKMGHREKARKSYVRSLHYKRQAKDVDGILYSLRGLARLSMEMKLLDEADHYLQECLERAQAESSELERAITIRHLGDLALLQEREDLFISYLREAIETFQRLNFSTELAEAAERLGEYYLDQGRERLAVPYLRLANLHYRKLLKKS